MWKCCRITSFCKRFANSEGAVFRVRCWEHWNDYSHVLPVEKWVTQVISGQGSAVASAAASRCWRRRPARADGRAVLWSPGWCSPQGLGGQAADVFPPWVNPVSWGSFPGFNLRPVVQSCKHKIIYVWIHLCVRQRVCLGNSALLSDRRLSTAFLGGHLSSTPVWQNRGDLWKPIHKRHERVSISVADQIVYKD